VDFDENTTIDEGASLTVDEARFLLAKCRKGKDNLAVQILDARKERDEARAQRDQYVAHARKVLHLALYELGFSADLAPAPDDSTPPPKG
jgi:hypothetical protein